MAEVQVKKVNWWHERLADWMIANPQKKLSDAALEFDCSVSWISIVKNSDSFKAFFAERSAGASDVILGGIKDRLAAVAEQTLELVEDRLDRNGMVMPYDELLSTSSMALKALGYGIASKSAPPAPSQVNVNIVTPELLAEARARRAAQLAGGQELPPMPLPQISTTRSSIEDL